MTSQAYLLLLALADGRQHGYGLAARVRELSDGDVRLGAGTLYGNLERLLGADLIADDGEEVADGRARRYYRLTDDGLRVARTETLRLAELAARGRRALGAFGADGAVGGVA
ncbi:PadR family transcriptional regulator [Sanguibacter sp. HDW7]|uniref:PadR family transcriptional regulator n=1 Tax=Sanguibacter sp. HDW7 TaxID=2714931 RepID=UPI00140DFD33|nr:helix-turn-helix transcriptional regulator [Sanguibacter sp. HDW7]QIK84548.1 PadR family transcriptional regulator [Sanguibacter sp. HDW7]